MRKPINIAIAFVAPAGTSGTVTLRHDARCGDKAHLAIDMGHQINASAACAPLTLDGMRRLVDGLLDSIDALERKGRIYGEDSHG